MRSLRLLTLASFFLVGLWGPGSPTRAESRPATYSATAPVFPARSIGIPSKGDRVLMAEYLKRSFVSEGSGIRIKAEGKDGKTLSVYWPSMKSPFVYKFTCDDRTIKRLQDAGFSRIHFGNGDRFWEQALE